MLDYTPVDPYEGEIADFVEAIRQSREPEVGGAEGLRNVEILTAPSSPREARRPGVARAATASRTGPRHTIERRPVQRAADWMRSSLPAFAEKDTVLSGIASRNARHPIVPSYRIHLISASPIPAERE